MSMMGACSNLLLLSMYGVFYCSKFSRTQGQSPATRPACKEARTQEAKGKRGKRRQKAKEAKGKRRQKRQRQKFTWTKTLAASCPEGTAAEGVLPATSAEAADDFSSAALSSSSSQSANTHSFISLTC